MRALIVYESMYGNTHAIANAIADGVRGAASANVCTTDEATAGVVADVDLLLVGGPTHVHGMSSKRSREGAIAEAAKTGELELDDAATSEGLRSWLDALPETKGVPAAAFDTRMPGPVLATGSAAKGIARRLRRRGYEVVSSPTSFVVEHTGGPLREGELGRACAWGKAVALGVRDRVLSTVSSELD